MLNPAYKQLIDIIKPYGKLCVSYSGGVDSTFLARAAVDALGGENVLCVLIKGFALPSREYLNAVEYIKTIGAKFSVLTVDEFEVEQFADNTPDRCYYCKKAIFDRIFEFMKTQGFETLACGSNIDDLSDYRPGNEAVTEDGVVCPLIDANLSKAQIRELSRQLLLPTADNPSSPCLASRVPYNQPVTRRKLQQVDAAEQFLCNLGFNELRVRHYGDTARIEVPSSRIEEFVKLRNIVVEELERIGFTYITLDLKGFRSGALNEQLFADGQ